MKVQQIKTPFAGAKKGSPFLTILLVVLILSAIFWVMRLSAKESAIHNQFSDVSPSPDDPAKDVDM